MLTPTHRSDKASAFARTLASEASFVATESSLPAGAPSSTYSSTLSPSLRSDLQRFADDPAQNGLLAALAASVRHARPLSLHLRSGTYESLLSVFPREQLFHCFMGLCALPVREFAALRLQHVEPAEPLDALSTSMTSTLASRLESLGPLLWRLAIHGASSELLPEIVGPARYRLSLGFSLSGLPVDSAALPILRCLREQPATLDELADATALGPDGARRLLNALYLQSGLMVTRSLPTRWFGRS